MLESPFTGAKKRGGGLSMPSQGVGPPLRDRADCLGDPIVVDSVSSRQIRTGHGQLLGQQR